jgi:hypothetical protein
MQGIELGIGQQGTEPGSEPAATPLPYPTLRQLVMEASQALARLDAARLEELALSCKALNRDLNRDSARDLNRGRNSNQDREQSRDLAGDLARDLTCGLTCSEAARRTQLGREAREAQGEMAVFARVLDGTRNNLNVLNRLRELRAGRLEYSVSSPVEGCAWSQPVRSQTGRSQTGGWQREPGHGDN